MTVSECVLRWRKRCDTIPKDTTVHYSCILLETSLSIEAVITAEVTVKSRRAQVTSPFSSQEEGENAATSSKEHHGTIFGYVAWFKALLSIKKNLRDQLIIEFACYMGLRSGEISSIRINHLNLETGDMEILDSKRHRFFTRPMTSILVIHCTEYLRITSKKNHDFLFSALPNAPRQGRKVGSKCRGEGLTEATIGHVFAKYSVEAGLPRVLTPREARAYFAYVVYYVKKVGIFRTKFLMRHVHIETTEVYLARIEVYEDIKAAFLSDDNSPFAPQFHYTCLNADKCPFFSPSQKIEEKMKQP